MPRARQRRTVAQIGRCSGGVWRMGALRGAVKGLRPLWEEFLRLFARVIGCGPDVVATVSALSRGRRARNSSSRSGPFPPRVRSSADLPLKPQHVAERRPRSTAAGHWWTPRGGVACSPPSRDQPNDDCRETRIQGVNLSPCCPPDLSPHLLGNQSRQILLKPHRKHWGEQLNGNLVQRSIASAARRRHLSAWGDLSRYSFGRAR